MAALAPPYVYATLNDVKIHSPMRAEDIDVVLRSLPHGAIEQLLEDYSRRLDGLINKRTETPLKFTPHAQIKMYVAKSVSAVLQEKFGLPPGSEQNAIWEAIRVDLQKWAESVISPDGFAEIPASTNGEGPTYKPQTLSSSSASPYPYGYGRRYA